MRMNLLRYAVVVSSALWLASASGVNVLIRSQEISLREPLEKIRSLSTLVQPPALYPAEGLELKAGTPGQTFKGDPDA